MGSNMQSKPGKVAIPAGAKAIYPGLVGVPPLSQRIFRKHDKDGSGSISNKEFGDLCYELGHHLTDKEIALAVKMIDTDGDGTIDYKEFFDWWRHDSRFANLQIPEADLMVINQWGEHFRKLDTDHSGTLDREEFKALHADLLAVKLTDKSYDKCLEDLDTDRSGDISFNEFISWLQRTREAREKMKKLA